MKIPTHRQDADATSRHVGQQKLATLAILAILAG
jgi:hypothetical protein